MMTALRLDLSDNDPSTTDQARNATSSPALLGFPAIMSADVDVKVITVGGETYCFIRQAIPAIPPESQPSHAEREVLSFLLRGLSNPEIAALRGTTVNTIANQVGALFRRLRVGSRLELAVRWMRMAR